MSASKVRRPLIGVCFSYLPCIMLMPKTKKLFPLRPLPLLLSLLCPSLLSVLLIHVGTLMNLFRPVLNANEKKQFCQFVKILVFNKCRKRWHMRKNSQKILKNTEKRQEPGGKRGGNKKTKKQRFFSFDHVAGHLLQEAW